MNLPVPQMMSPQQAAQQRMAASAQGNLMAGYLLQPPKQGANRAKVDDGDHVIQIKSAEIKESQAGSGRYLLITYIVTDSTVARCIGQEFSYVQGGDRPYGAENICDLYKILYGMENAKQLALANPPWNTEQIAMAVAQGLMAHVQQGGCHGHLRAKRSQKKLREGKGYEELYPNHYWQFFTNQPFTLAAINIANHASASVPAQMAPAMPQMPQAPQMQPQMAPAMPQMQPAYQAPQMQPQMAPAMTQMPQAPQAYGMPQVAVPVQQPAGNPVLMTAPPPIRR